MHRVVFLGSPEAAVPSLRALAAHPACSVTGVFTQPDRPAGRGRALKPSPVRQAAQALGLPVHTPERIRAPEALAALQACRPELLVACAYGQIFPQAVLALPPAGAFNLHFSLLPRWRGASPVQAAILAGDSATGVSLQKMVLELDAGPIAAESAPIAIASRDTAETLGARLAEAAAALLADALAGLFAGPALRGQDAARATFCRTIEKKAGAVDWEAESAEEIERKARAFTPWPGCFAFLGRRRLGLVRLEVAPPPAEAMAAAPGTVFSAAPGTVLAGGLVPAREGWLRLLEVKPEGKGAMAFAAFLNGTPAALGARLAPAPTEK